MKKVSLLICLSLSMGMIMNSTIVQGSVVEQTNQVIENTEVTTAKDMELIPEEWESDLSKEADFSGFDQLITSLISLCDGSALSVWRQNVDSSAFPQRAMMRDDGLILLMLAAETLGYNTYNARDYAFCTENEVDYETMFSQLSQEYPYCDTEREIPMYFETVGGDEDPIGNVSTSAVFWHQRRMDINHRIHFFDCDEKLNFHFDQPLTREDAVAAVVRFYNSTCLDYDPLMLAIRKPNGEDEVLLTAAEAMKQAILDNADEWPCEGTAYYVSNDGDDGNDGLSPEAPWATLERVNATQMSYGDGVYFKRGGTWRGQLLTQEGIVYSAYGEGDKPKLFASPENGADSSKWSLLDGTDNIWVYHEDMMDCGVLVFDDGESWGTKVAPNYLNGYLSTLNEGQPFDVKTELKKDLMFFSEADSILYDGAPFRYSIMDTNDRGEFPGEVVGQLYLRCDAGNPGDVFDSIEFSVRQNIIVPSNGDVFHNLCLKYTGAHGIYGGDMSFDVSFCEIGWIGGSPQYYHYEDGKPELFGNGVECDGSYDHYSVTNCVIYQCFDAGVSNQDPMESDEVTGGENDRSIADVIMKNISYSRNVFEYDDMPIEIFIASEDDAGYGRHRMENVLIEGNYFLYTGYGWASMQNGKAEQSSAYMGHQWPNASENFRIVNNVFYLSSGSLLRTGAPKKWQPELDGNTYVQNDGGVFIRWPNAEGIVIPFAFYYNNQQDTVTEVIQDVLGDQNATVFMN